MTADTVIEASKRQAKRDALFLSATLVVEGIAKPVTVRVRNLSNGGMMIDAHPRFQINQHIATDLRGIGEVTGRIAWVEAGRAGVAFDELVDPKLARHHVPNPAESTIIAAPKIYDRRPGLRTRA